MTKLIIWIGVFISVFIVTWLISGLGIQIGDWLGKELELKSYGIFIFRCLGGIITVFITWKIARNYLKKDKR